MITAMTTFIVLSVVALAVLLIVSWVSDLVHQDGYGPRSSPPPSHHQDLFDPRNRFA
jgi:hypothetical protein